ncbi:MAG: SPOR domain-containing protein, partial [Sphingomonas sp.]
ATGEWDVARQTLATHSATIPASDRGLAMALAGDPAGAVALLMEIARQPGADAKTRQNLALSLALAGQWQQARAIAALDLSPDEVDGRIMQWASFARPQNAYDQVASLLGVTPVADNGQPERLALAQSMTSAVAAARVADPVETYMPGPAPVEAVAAVAATAVDVAATDVAQGPSITAPSGQQIVFGPRQEIVQAIPTRAVRAETSVASVGATKPVKVDVPSAQRFATGSWYVQLGAYDSIGVARDSWGRMVRRTPQLKALTPSSASVSTKAGAFQRLSVGGLARADADALCREVRSDGGKCFVRTAAGDKKASWLR